MALDPALLACLGKIEGDVLADLSTLLVPGLIAEIEALSPANAKAVEVMVFSAIQPAIQAAFASLVAKIVPV